MAARSTAEEFYSRCLGNVATLSAASRRFAESGDSVQALALAWGADIYGLQAVVWERLQVASSYPQRQFFRVAEALVAEIGAGAASDAPADSAADLLRSMRAQMLNACEPDLREGVERAWGDAGLLSGVPWPSAADFEASVTQRTGGIRVAGFVSSRRTAAATAMAEAQALRIKGMTVPAIQGAYDADLLATEAYLVESAASTSDAYLLTVPIRWELATTAVASLPGLPDGFTAAVARIRETMAAALGDADGYRLVEALPKV